MAEELSRSVYGVPEAESLGLTSPALYRATPDQVERYTLPTIAGERCGTKVQGVTKQPVRLGLRWIVQAMNWWWSNYRQLRRNTDRRKPHRHAALCLATTILIIGRLLDYRNRWSPAG